MSTIKLGDCRGIIESVNEACTCGGAGPGEGCPACEVFHAIKDMEFEDGNEGPPKEQSPELAEAEARLRREATAAHGCVERKQCALIAGEIDRLRAENARIEAECARLRAIPMSKRVK